LSLGSFIYFIHSISQEIQVNTIMDKIFKKAKVRLDKLIEDEKHNDTAFEDTSNWNHVMADSTGYMQDVSLNSLADLAEEHQLKIEIVPIKGAYVLKGIPILKYKGDSNDELEKQLAKAITFSNSELIEDNYVLAFKQITEIALKAMSPGINDPGTCINSIDYLTELFALRMTKKDKSYYFNENETALIFIKTVSFEQLLYNVMASLRTYCKHDIIIVQKLFLMLQYLLQNSNVLHESYSEVVVKEIKNLEKDALDNHKNEADIAVIKSCVKRLQDVNTSGCKI